MSEGAGTNEFVDQLLAAERLDALGNAAAILEYPVPRERDEATCELVRSHGGSDDPSNRISLCAAHHLNGVHMGWIKVSGTAPDELRWKLGRP